jgi:hypothetical protein
MSRIDKVRSEFRARVAAGTAIAGVFGPTGLEDLALVTTDANGELVVATQGLAKGIIMTTEGKADSGVASFLTAAAGSMVTVFTACEIVDDGATVGDEYWSTAAGDVVTTEPVTPIQLVATVYNRDPAKGGTKTVYNIVSYSK